MFQFRPFPSYTYLIQCTILEYCSSGFPHSEICGSTDICSFPQLIAAYHVLRRLLMPRHSPCALYSLTFESLADSQSWIMQALTGFYFEIVIVTLHLFRCCPQLKLLKFLPNYSFERPLCCLAYHFRLFFVQFSRYNFLQPLLQSDLKIQTFA